MKPLRNLPASISPTEHSRRWATSSRAISRLTKSVAVLASIATYSAMFVASAVLPMLGRAARMINSESCRPAGHAIQIGEAAGHAHAFRTLQPRVDPLEGLHHQVVGVDDLVVAPRVVDGEDFLFGLTDDVVGADAFVVGAAEDFGAGVDQRPQRGLLAHDVGVVDGVGRIGGPTAQPRPDRPRRRRPRNRRPASGVRARAACRSACLRRASP